MVTTNKKESWRQKRTRLRAESECAVIDACIIQADSMSRDSQKIIADLDKLVKTLSDELAQRYSANDDIGELTVLREEVEMYKAQIVDERDYKEMFMTLVQVLKDLRMQTSRLMRNGEYKFVIRTIPEKALPKYISGATKETLDEIIAKANEIYTILKDRSAEVRMTKVKQDANRKRDRAVYEGLREKNGDTEAQQRAKMERFMADMAKTSPTVPVPAEMDAASHDATKPTNKA